jgi:YD repeat-containing protein
MARDADSHLLSVVNSRNRGIAFRNDSAGRIVGATVIGSDKVVTYEYDDLGRLKHVGNAGLKIYANPKFELVMLFMEFIGWLPKSIPESIDYEYDAFHNMTRMKDSTGFEMVNNYDASSRVIHQTLSDGRSWFFDNQVDKKGNILQTEITHPDQTVKRMTFDISHNTLTESYPLGLPSEIKWIYK